MAKNRQAYRGTLRTILVNSVLLVMAKLKLKKPSKTKTGIKSVETS